MDNYLEHKDTSAKCVSGHDFVTSTHSLKQHYLEMLTSVMAMNLSAGLQIPGNNSCFDSAALLCGINYQGQQLHNTFKTDHVGDKENFLVLWQEEHPPMWMRLSYQTVFFLDRFSAFVLYLKFME